MDRVTKKASRGVERLDDTTDILTAWSSLEAQISVETPACNHLRFRAEVMEQKPQFDVALQEIERRAARLGAITAKPTAETQSISTILNAADTVYQRLFFVPKTLLCFRHFEEHTHYTFYWHHHNVRRGLRHSCRPHPTRAMGYGARPKTPRSYMRWRRWRSRLGTRRCKARWNTRSVSVRLS